MVHSGEGIFRSGEYPSIFAYLTSIKSTSSSDFLLCSRRQLTSLMSTNMSGMSLFTSSLKSLHSGSSFVLALPFLYLTSMSYYARLFLQLPMLLLLSSMVSDKFITSCSVSTTRFSYIRNGFHIWSFRPIKELTIEYCAKLSN